MQTFTKLDNKTVSYGSVLSVTLDNGCHFCTCLVRCTEDVYCVGAEINKIGSKCRLLLLDNSTGNVHVLTDNIKREVYITPEFNEYGEIQSTILTFLCYFVKFVCLTNTFITNMVTRTPCQIENISKAPSCTDHYVSTKPTGNSILGTTSGHNHLFIYC